jgi:ABC-type bacteriocin/lantibiotic exporter with double-glycine peptidase domain
MTLGENARRLPEARGAHRIALDADPAAEPRLPQNIFRYILATSAVHQVALSLLTVMVFLLEFVPLELQRRVVNDLVKNRNFRFVIVLCAVYLAVVLTQGGIKLVVNVYRAWVGECATRDLRKRVRALIEASPDASRNSEASGVEISMIVAEVEPLGAFAGAAVSEPLLQAGVLATVIAYLIHLEPWIAFATLAIFAPQIVFVPLMQGAINRSTASRVHVLREVSAEIIEPDDRAERRIHSMDTHIARVFQLDMGIFKLKYSMNFLMNLCSHLQIIAALLVGGWFVATDRLGIGGVVAFISAIGRLNDPWGDLVNYFRDMNSAQVKFRLVADAVDGLRPPRSGAPRDAGAR